MVLNWKAPTESGCHLNQSKVLLSTDYLEDGAPTNVPASTTVELWGVLGGEAWARGRDFFGRPGESEGEETISYNGSEEDLDDSRFGDEDDAQVDGDRFWQEKEQLPFDGLLLTNEHLGQVLVQEVAVGGSHCVLITDAGHAFAYGSNGRGQLGLGDYSFEDPASCLLSPVPPLMGRGAQPQIIIGAACGGEHTLFLTRDANGTSQKAFVAGAWEACGLDSCQDQVTPALLPFEHSVSAIAARAGCSCCAVAESDPQQAHLLYLWGEVDCCPCPDVLDQPTPCFRLERPVRTLRLGSAFGLALDVAGEVFAWGDSTYGELGNAPVDLRPPHSPMHAEPSQLPVPGKVVLPVEQASRAAQDAAGNKKDGAEIGPKAVIDIACGERFSLMLDEDGRLYSFGENLAGQCGVPEAVGSGHVTGCSVQRVRFVPVERAVPHHDGTTSYQPERGARVFAGRWHSAMITRDHRLYVWGHPSNRKLGHAGFNHDGTEAGEDPQGVCGAKSAQKSKGRPPGVAVRSALRDAVRRPRLVFALLHRRVRSVGLGDECTVVVSGDGGRAHEDDPMPMPGVCSVGMSDAARASELDLPDLEALERPLEIPPEESAEVIAPSQVEASIDKEQDAPVPCETRFSL